MKKYCIVISLLFVSIVRVCAVTYEPLSKWMLFTGSYAFLDNSVNKQVNFGGGQEVVASAIMSNGNTVFAVADKGIYVFDGKKAQALKMPDECFAANSDILSMGCDSKDVLWIGTAQGLVKYENNAFTNIPKETTGLLVITDIAITATDKVYISGMLMGEKGYVGGGIAFYNGASWAAINKSNSQIPDDLMSNLMLDNNGHLWAIPGKHDMGVAKFDGKNWKLFNNASGLPVNTVNAIATNASGKVWLGSPKGIIEYDGTTFTIKMFMSGFSPKLSEYTSKSQDGTIDVSSLAVENNGTVWVGTKSWGVLALANGGLKVLNQQNSPLISNAVYRISIDKDGQKWFVAGYRNDNYAQYAPFDTRNRHTYFTEAYGGVTVYKEHAKLLDPKWAVYDNTNSVLGLGSSNSIYEDKEGAIWFPNTADGLVKMKDKTFTSFTFSNAMHGAFFKMYVAPDNKMYLAATLGGIKVFENGTIKEYAKSPGMGGVVDLTLDKNNVMWSVGGSGISKFSNNEWETFNKKDGLPSMIFYSILKDSKGTMWAGSAKGLVKYNDTAWVQVGADVDFPSDDFTALAEDNTGKLWLGCNKGISIYDGKTFTNIPKVESLDLNKFRVNTIFIDKNNVAWIGTEVYGVLRYDGTTWTQISKKNSGGIFDKVTAIRMATDGKLYVISESTKMAETEFHLPNQSADEMLKQELAKKVKMAEPSRFLSVIQL